MAILKAFLDALPTVATSPYALVAYVCVVAAWVLRLWQVGRPEREAAKILTLFKDDAQRNKALTQLLGNAPPGGLPSNEVLEWVRIQSTGRARGFVLVAYLATLVAVLVIIVLTLVKASDTTRASASVRLLRLADDSCVVLPPNARLRFTTNGGSLASISIVNGCEGQLEWRASKAGPQLVSFDLDRAGPYRLAEPARGYWIHPDDTLQLRVVHGDTAEPRRKILLLPFASGDPNDKEKQSFLTRILDAKVGLLRDHLAHREPATAISQLKLQPASDAGTMSGDEQRQRWNSEYLLEIWSGILFSREGHTIARGELYIGDPVIPTSLHLDLYVDPDGFNKLNDSYALAILYGLAQDAERTNAPPQVITAYLDEATDLCGRLAAGTDDGTRELKQSVAGLLERWRATAGAVCQ